MTSPLCTDCSQPIGGPRSGGHCMSCHKSFSTDRAFDKHRTGKFGVDRRCMTEEEMTSLRIPMRQLPNGRWATGGFNPDTFSDVRPKKAA